MVGLVDRIRAGEFTLIAEIGVNYYDIAVQRDISSMEAAKLMCLEAMRAGVHVVKFQTYKAERLASKESPSYWDNSREATTNQYELFKKYDSFGESEYCELSAYCAQIGIEFCSTAFDQESADYLEPLMPVYKVSSSDLTNLPFVEYLARKGAPMIVSVGAGRVEEMREAVTAIRKSNSELLVLCHCVLEYPTPYSHANLRRIASLAREFPDVVIGYSDHCVADAGADVAKIAYALGARVLEKHFTLDKSLPGNDHYHAMDPDDARRILNGVTLVEQLLGRSDLNFSDSESAARRNARRSVVATCNISAGGVITRDMLTFKRPGTGISPKDVEDVVGRTARIDILEDCVVTPDMISGM